MAELSVTTPQVFETLLARPNTLQAACQSAGSHTKGFRKEYCEPFMSGLAGNAGVHDVRGVRSWTCPIIGSDGRASFQTLEKIETRFVRGRRIGCVMFDEGKMMSRIFLCFVLGIGLAAAMPGRADIFAQNKALGRGANIIGYDPVWRSQDQARFQAKHFQLLHDAGFQNVRVNLAPFRAMDRDKNWALRDEWLKTLDWVVREATAQKLMVILDCHEYHAMAEDPEGRKEQFLSFWRQLSEHCASAPDNVLFELLNEPNKKMTPKLWNDFARDALAVVREKNPTRPVIIGPGFWNSVDHIDELELPENDRNLIVTVHYYKPMEFTHQGASWAGQKDKSGIVWPQSEKDGAAVSNDFAKVSAWAKTHNRPVFLGEFGAYDKAPMESRVRYADFVARAAEANGWSWAWWQFDGDFILYDIKRDAWVEPILRALIPAKGDKP